MNLNLSQVFHQNTKSQFKTDIHFNCHKQFISHEISHFAGTDSRLCDNFHEMLAADFVSWAGTGNQYNKKQDV